MCSQLCHGLICPCGGQLASPYLLIIQWNHFAPAVACFGKPQQCCIRCHLKSANMLMWKIKVFLRLCDFRLWKRAVTDWKCEKSRGRYKTVKRDVKRERRWEEERKGEGLNEHVLVNLQTSRVQNVLVWSHNVVVQYICVCVCVLAVTSHQEDLNTNNLCCYWVLTNLPC